MHVAVNDWVKKLKDKGSLAESKFKIGDEDLVI